MKDKNNQAGRPWRGLALLCVLALAVMALALIHQRSGGRPISTMGVSLERPVLRIKEQFGYGAEPEDGETEQDWEQSLLDAALEEGFPGWENLTQGEYKSRYGYQLAAPEDLPEGFVLCPGIYVREDGEGSLILGRAWLDEENGLALLVTQLRTPAFENRLEYPGGGTVTNLVMEDGTARSGPFPGVIRWQFAIRGWEIEGRVLMTEPATQQADGEQLLRSLRFSGLGSEDVYQQQSIATDSGKLGDFSYELRLLEELPGALYWSETDGQGVHPSAPAAEYRLRVRLLDEEGKLRQQFDYPVYALPAFQAVDGRTRDLNADGSADLMVSSAGELFGFVYDPFQRGLVEIRELAGGSAQLQYDPITNLLRRKSGETAVTYDVYQVKGEALDMVARLIIDLNAPAESRCSEYEVINGHFYPRGENVGIDVIDHEKWNFVDTWG